MNKMKALHSMLLFVTILINCNFLVRTQFLESTYSNLGEDLSNALDKIVEVKFKNYTHPFEIIYNDTIHEKINLAKFKISNKLKHIKNRENLKKMKSYLRLQHQNGKRSKRVKRSQTVREGNKTNDTNIGLKSNLKTNNTTSNSTKIKINGTNKPLRRVSLLTRLRLTNHNLR